jgi:hypothetical protein
MNNSKNIIECELSAHEIHWESKRRWRGIYPRYFKGVCLICGAQFKKWKEGDKEYVEQVFE